MKLPRSLKIGGRIYRVLFPYIFKDSCSVLYGQCDESGQKIRISGINSHGEQRHPQAIMQTFIHELLHAIDYIYVGGKVAKLDGGEDIIDQLAEGITQVFRDNKIEWRPK